MTIENNLKSRGQLLHTAKPVRRVEKSRLGERIETSEIGAEPVEPPLSHRHQRHVAHAASGKFLEHLGFVVLGRCQQNRKTGDRFHLEDVTRGEHEPGVAGTGDELNRHDRIAAHREERVVDAHRFDTEDIDEQGGQRAFGIGFGGPRACLGCSQVGNRQGSAVELSVGSHRQFVENDHDRRNHVRGQSRARERDDGLGIHSLSVVGRHDVSDDPCGASVTFERGHHGMCNAGIASQNCLDLAEFDAESANLDLEIASTLVLEFAVLVPPGEVAGSVHPCARTARGIGHESFGGRAGAVSVTAGESVAADVQLSRHSDRDAVQAIVEDPRGDACRRATDRDSIGRGHRLGDAGDDRRFGWSVGIDHDPVIADPGGDEVGWADVAAGSDAHQLVQSARIDRGQCGWCDEGVRDVLVGDQTRQFGSADDARWGDDHRGPGTNSHQEFENRGVEAR